MPGVTRDQGPSGFAAWDKTALSDFRLVWTPRELVDVGIGQPPDFAGVRFEGGGDAV